jgi:RNA polymerase sigma factor (sigma-70 family)
MTNPEPTPTADDRRRAACAAMAQAPGLIRFAARYTRSLHDAEDAYQRAMEIALIKAPVTDPQRFLAWLHTVLRNEALAVARGRRREGPAAEADVPESYGDQLEEAVEIDAMAEWRERYRSIQDGLGGLTDAQRVCLMLKTAGASYERIREITGFTMRKVERSVLEGRASLRAWEVRLSSGEACARMDVVIDAVLQDTASARDRRALSRHLRHCGHCRSVLRERREANEWLAGLVPLALFAGHAFAGAPDPSPMIAWWERLAGGATVRAGTVVQMAMDLPSSALAKVGAGTAAVAVAGAAGAPMVVDAVHPRPHATPVVASRVVTPAAPGPAAADRAQEARAEAQRASRAAARRSAARRALLHERAVRAERARRAALQAARARSGPDPAVPVSTSRPAPAPAPAPAAAPASPAAPAAPSPQSMALEFGP